MASSSENAAAILDLIVSRAQEFWGEDWKAELVRAYCLIESNESGETVKPVERRSQLMRALEVKSTSLETALRLASAVNLKIAAETIIEIY